MKPNLDAVTGVENPTPISSSLSFREKEVVGLVSRGMRNKEIADVLLISERTVKNHLSNIFDKLDISKRERLAFLAAKEAYALDPAKDKRLLLQERRVLESLARGRRTNLEIAKDLGWRAGNVPPWYRSLRDKLDARSSEEILAEAALEGLLPK